MIRGRIGWGEGVGPPSVVVAHATGDALDAGGTDVQQVDDLSLVAAARAGDERAARIFYARHAAACLRLATARLRDAALAEDVVHDAFEALWRKVADGGVESGADGTLRGLLLTITHRRAIDVTRSAWSRRHDRTVAVPDVADDGDGPGARLERRAERDRVHEAVQEIDEPYRTVLLLDLAGHDNRSVAELTGRRPNTVAQQRRRALARLRDVLVEAEPGTVTEPTPVTPAPPVPPRAARGVGRARTGVVTASSGLHVARSTGGGGGVT